MKNSNKFIITLIVLILIIFAGVMFGSSNLTISDLGDNTIVNTIILKIRFPRVFLAFIVGGSLSISGLCIQSLLKNPLASPYTLGISNGAGLSATIAIVLKLNFLGIYTTQIIAFLGALITIYFIIKFVSLIDNNLGNETIVLTGMILSLLLGALISLIMLLNLENSKQILLFLSGSIAMKGWQDIILILPFFIICSIYLFIRSKQLDILSFGEDDAHSLGVNVKKLKNEIMILTSLLTACAVSICGVIGFVGLVVPHICRKVFGSNHVITIPLSIMIGGGFLIATDLLARTIAPPIELPVGAITALIGAPFFAIIFIMRRKK
ncbi:MAG: FecCD family ABC transporter permease [Bacilli bacterium]